MQLGPAHQYEAAPPQPQKLEHRQSAEQTEGHVQYGQVETSGQKPKKTCSARSIHGRVAGQHVHGFLIVCRSVETEQNAWYSNGTQKK